MAERLPNQCEIDVASDEMTRQRMLEYVGMTLLARDACDRRNRLKHSEELGPVDPAALLRRWSQWVEATLSRSPSEGLNG